MLLCKLCSSATCTTCTGTCICMLVIVISWTEVYFSPLSTTAIPSSFGWRQQSVDTACEHSKLVCKCLAQGNIRWALNWKECFSANWIAVYVSAHRTFYSKLYNRAIMFWFFLMTLSFGCPACTCTVVLEECYICRAVKSLFHMFSHVFLVMTWNKDKCLTEMNLKKIIPTCNLLI